MTSSSFADMPCPIARSLDRVGEWWSILILRDALAGMTRFDQFQRNLGIAPNILTRRLAGLVEAGLLEKRRYSERPPRHEYVLTPRGRDFREVLQALLDRNSGRRMTDPVFGLVAGPAATPAVHAQLAARKPADPASD